jgi:hypothetical protein
MSKKQRYSVTVTFSGWVEVILEATSKKQAGEKAKQRFDASIKYPGEWLDLDAEDFQPVRIPTINRA